MGNYIDVTDVQERFANSVDYTQLINKDTEEEREAVVNNIINKSEGLIDFYVGQKYSIPTTVNSEVIKEWALCLVDHALYKRNESDEIPKKISKAYDDTIEMLVKISKGEMKLQASSNASSISLISEEDSYFSDMTGY